MSTAAAAAEVPVIKPNADTVVLAHVSDIHFRKPAGGAQLYTPDDDLRHEMKNDLGVMAKKLGALHGILVTGDIAFGGDPEEYKYAREWLLDVCQRTGCPEECIRTIAGNHDVVRSTMAKSISLRNAHEALRVSGRAGDADAINRQILEYLGDESIPELLFSAINHYNDFAKQFRSEFRRTHPFWEWDIILNDGSTLRIRGLNSTIVSDSTDNRGDNRLVLGPLFCTVPREEGREYLVLCHHPPDWLWDSDKIDDYLNTRARIQLFGHKHVQRVREQTQDGFKSLRVHAGALNPEAGQGEYLPRYNCLAIKVTEADNERMLEIELHCRVWVAEGTRFDDAAHDGVQRFKLPLSAWNRAAATAGALLFSTGAALDRYQNMSDPLGVIGTDAAKTRALSGAQRIAYRFLSLSFPQRIDVANALGLLSDEDQGQPDSELFRRFFRRAAERSKLSEMWREVEKRHTDGRPDDNPFESL